MSIIKIGYLIPEFPSQTHNFYCRERDEVEKNNISVEIISTKKPSSMVFSTDLASKQNNRTTYLYPLGLKDFCTIIYVLFMSGPSGWRRCIRSITRSDGKGLLYYMRLLVFVVMGARLSWHARKNKLKHIHVHSCANAANIALYAYLLTGLPYSITLHGPLTDYGLNQKEKWIHAKFAIVITKKIFNEIPDQLKNSLPNKIKIAPMGVHLSSFERNNVYKPWDLVQPLKLFTCGRLNKVKGHEDLIRAVLLLRESGTNANLVIAGEDDSENGTVRTELENLIMDNGLSTSVQLLGAVSENRIRKELENAHIFALPSWSEPLGVVIMEAMAMRLPVIATNAGGVPEIVEHAVTGILVDPKSPAQLAKGIMKIATDPVFANQLSQCGYDKVSIDFHSGLSAKIISDFVQKNHSEALG